MRLIDADALMEILTTAIRNMKEMAKFLGVEDDPEIQMEIKAYTDIANGVNGMPTIEPERKTGKWIDGKRMKFDGTFYWFRQCNQCGYERNDCDTEKDSNFCPDCGADMRQIGGQDGER